MEQHKTNTVYIKDEEKRSKIRETWRRIKDNSRGKLLIVIFFMLLIGIMIFWGVKCNKAWNKIPRYTITTGLHPYKCVIESVDNTVFTETFNIDIRGLNHKKCQFLVSIHQKKRERIDSACTSSLNRYWKRYYWSNRVKDAYLFKEMYQPFSINNKKVDRYISFFLETQSDLKCDNENHNIVECYSKDFKEDGFSIQGVRCLQVSGHGAFMKSEITVDYYRSDDSLKKHPAITAGPDIVNCFDDKIFFSPYDISQAIFNYKILDTNMNCDTVKFVFSDYVDVESVCPEPDRRSIKVVEFNTPQKIQEIKKNGLSIHCEYPTYKVISDRRTFLLASFFSVVMSLMSAGLYGLIDSLLKKNRKKIKK